MEGSGENVREGEVDPLIEAHLNLSPDSFDLFAFVCKRYSSESVRIERVHLRGLEAAVHTWDAKMVPMT